MNKKEFFRRCKQSKFFVGGGIMVIIIVGLSIIAPFIVPYDAELSNLKMKFQEPTIVYGWSGGYILGGDSLGRDVLTRLLIGARYSLKISFVSVFFGAIIGTAAGLIAGYFGRWADTIIMRFGDVQLSIPQTLLAIAIVAILGPSVNNLIIVLIITGWPQYARVIRATVMTLRDSDFVSSARVIGSSNTRILISDILPNTISSLLIMFTEQIGLMILIEAAMSFLGVGVQAPTPSWGLMISEGRNYLSLYPWVVMVPGIALMVTVLAFSFLGDGLRDIFDPKMRDV